MEATAYNWLHFYWFSYNQFWSELDMPEFDWHLGVNAVLVSQKPKTLIDIAGAIAAPCCLLEDWNLEFWAQKSGTINQRPSVRLLETWSQVECTWMGSQGKKLIPTDCLDMALHC